MRSLENRVAAMEVSAPLAQPADIDDRNRATVRQSLLREFGDYGARFFAMCKRVENGHATPDDDRIMAAAVDGWVSMPGYDGREYVLALGHVLAELEGDGALLPRR
ncbi:MAG: hypothetical protein HXX19_20780 [Rhodoferax sp.]|nr:hypothetical protein [Rhodoferax sp.]